MRVIITGVQGWLGRFTAAAILRQTGTQVLGIGRSIKLPGFTHFIANDQPAPLPQDLIAEGQNYCYQACDLLDNTTLRPLLVDFQPTHVIHLAAGLPGADATELKRLNVAATASLLQTLNDAKLRPKVIMGSTGSIYGEPAYLPQDETHPINALTVYAISKWQAERTAMLLAERFAIALLRVRIFNLVGPGHLTLLLPGSLAMQLAAIAHGLQAPYIKMGPLTTVRDYIDVRDCAKALYLLTRLESDFTNLRVLNIASGQGVPMIKIWQCLRSIALRRGGPMVEIVRLSPASANVSSQIGCTKRLTTLGFQCTTPLEQSLDALYDWALSALQINPKQQPLGV